MTELIDYVIWTMAVETVVIRTKEYHENFEEKCEVNFGL